MKIDKIPIYILLFFTAVYMVFGNPENAIWSGIYFLSNYFILLILFLENKDKAVRLVGASLSVAILLFIVLKFFISLDTEKLRYCNLITFTLVFIGLYKLESK